jgi:hypothetical protein
VAGATGAREREVDAAMAFIIRPVLPMRGVGVRN